MAAPLNIFQRAMLQWNDLHPYNAVHVVRLPVALDPARLSLAIHQTLTASGLTNLHLHRAQRTYHYQGGPTTFEIKSIPADANPQLALAREIEAQLNRPFTAQNPFNPFRFFTVADSDAFFLGAIYFHAVADAESLVYLMQRIVTAYQTQAQNPADHALEIHPGRRDHLWRQPATLARKLADLPRQIHHLRQSCRARYRDSSDDHIGYKFFALEPAALRGLIATAKARGVTVNDFFLALLLKSLSPLTADRLKSSRRRRLSVGCIVNLRKELGVASAHTFGLFLGSFIVSHEVPENLPLPELAGAIQRQTAAIKRKRLFLGSGLELALAGRVLALFSTERRKKLYQKNYPLWGGITNMNLNSLWPQPEGTPRVDYFRAVSTGPVTPLVLSVTTLGDTANIGLTYRTTLFSEPMIADLQRNFLNGLQTLALPA